MSLSEHFRACARNNAWSNHRLLRACAALSLSEFEATRTSFFPSLQKTLNHILIVDRFYLDGLERGGRGPATYADELPCPRLADLAAAQRASDLRLVRFCDGLGEENLEREVPLDRGEHGVTRESVHAVLSHLFAHQIHHRGQAHAMLAGTSVAPPQLDEFFLAWDEPLRRAELAELGLADQAGRAAR
ncbi:MAG TPA: DinB family protein [Myxococcota bacterium]|nr:DinB family protein [Myxococcota bacterium]